MDDHISWQNIQGSGYQLSPKNPLGILYIYYRECVSRDLSKTEIILNFKISLVFNKMIFNKINPPDVGRYCDLIYFFA